MVGKLRFSRCFVAAAILVIAQLASLVTVDLVFTTTAHAQFFRDQRYQERQPQFRSGGFFEDLFGIFKSRPYKDEFGASRRPLQHREQISKESSRAPPPRKAALKGEYAEPKISIVVMGDGMADWLAYGLEESFFDSPEIGVIRKNKLYSGLVHYATNSDLDWWHTARDILSDQKANYVVMMLGLNDRKDIREKELEQEAAMPADDQKGKTKAVKSGMQKSVKSTDKNKTIVLSNQRSKKTISTLKFRSEKWANIYSRRIDETMAALKSRGVPVLWVGLPSIRGARSTADAAYLNDLYRAAADHAGVAYVDIWDGFVNENGKYSRYGPDYLGQTRRLRSSDGVFFTKYGALKLAHYVKRELLRYLNNRVMVGLPSGSGEASEGKSTVRPLVGPVVPLTNALKNSSYLLGGIGGSKVHRNPVAAKVFVKGKAMAAPPGRADNFAWSPEGETNSTQPKIVMPARRQRSAD